VCDLKVRRIFEKSPKNRVKTFFQRTKNNYSE
jgi:hypothetical protein